MSYNSIDDMIDEMNEQARRTVDEHMTYVNADKVGLDRRAGMVYVNEDYIATEGCSSSLNYYGGFEYVDSDDVRNCGDFVFYSRTSKRVRGCIDFFYGRESEEEEDEE